MIDPSRKEYPAAPAQPSSCLQVLPSFKQTSVLSQSSLKSEAIDKILEIS